MTNEEFTALVKDMRTHQKKWFDNKHERTQTLLSTCKSLEAQVDIAVLQMEKKIGTQKTLEL